MTEQELRDLAATEREAKEKVNKQQQERREHYAALKRKHEDLGRIALCTVRVTLNNEQKGKLKSLVDEIGAEWVVASNYKKETVKTPWWRPDKEYWPKQPELKWHYIMLYCPYTSSVVAERLFSANAILSVSKLASAGDELYLSPEQADAVARFL